MPERRRPIEAPCVLLVEGEDEKRFFCGFVDRTVPGKQVQVIAAGGKYSFQNDLEAIVKDAGFDEVRWLGIVQDADTDAQSALQRIQSALTGVELPVPSAAWVPTPTNTVPVVVAIVLPDGSSPGDLEDLLLRAVERDEPSRMKCIDAYFDCLQMNGVQQPRQVSKAKTHAYLSSLERPDLQLGVAAQAGLLPLGSSTFDALRELIAGED